MTRRYILPIAAMFSALVSLVGCGASSVTKPVGALGSGIANLGKGVTRGVAGVVKKPIDSLKSSRSAPDAAARRNGIEDRTCNDDYGTTTSNVRRSERPTAARDMYDPSEDQVQRPEPRKGRRSFAQTSDKEEIQTLRRGLSGELEVLNVQRKRLNGQLREYDSRVREGQEMRELYTEQLKKTEAKIGKLQDAMEWIDRDPEGAFSSPVSEGTRIGQYRADEPRLQAAPDGVMSGGPEAGAWRSADGAGSTDNWKPPVLPRKKGPEEWQSRSATVRGPASPPSMDNLRTPVPVKPSQKPAAGAGGIATSVLAIEGTGGDAQLMLGAGRNSGVKPGMTFKTSNGAIIVVTDIYPTMAKAYLHPQYASSKIQPNVRVVQIPSLPGK